jgi:hypothetical protein
MERPSVSSVYSYSDSIAKAFLPNQGMRFNGAGDARVHDWEPALSSAVGASRRTVAAQLPASYPTATTTGSSPAANGTISGGMLRPGAIDQSQFKAMLAAGSLGGSAAAQGQLTGRPPLAPMAAMAAQGLQPAASPTVADAGGNPAGGGDSAIQTLSPAQFAALTGAMPAATAQIPAGATPDMSATSRQPLPADVPAAFRNLPADTLTLTDAAIPPDSTEAQTASTAAASPKSAADQSAAPQQAGDQTPPGTRDKNGVLALTQEPDKDTRREYAAKGIKWKLVDNPAADKLFFGPDGKFGWDDVVDLINPLQHIPLVNIVYRHLTGDQITGSAELLGAIPFGPLGALAAIADLAVRSTTGKDIGENAIAMLTGENDKTADNVASTGATASGATTVPGEETAMNTAAAATAADPFGDASRDHDQGHG